MKEKRLKKYCISSTQLKMWNYSRKGYYFVTICTKGNEEYFGKILNYEMSFNRTGLVTQTYWKEIPRNYPFVSLDAFIIMPNHIHGIIIIEKDGVASYSLSNILGEILDGFKAAVIRWCRKNGYADVTWQPRYYDRIIKNERELFNIRKYIIYNPVKWDDDEFNI